MSPTKVLTSVLILHENLGQVGLSCGDEGSIPNANAGLHLVASLGTIPAPADNAPRTPGAEQRVRTRSRTLPGSAS